MDNKTHPVELIVPMPEKSSRLLALATLLFAIPKLIMLIPHMVILYFLGIAAFFAVILAQFVVLFTGKYPQSFFDFIRGVFQWQIRVNAFFAGLTDTYPPFSLR